MKLKFWLLALDACLWLKLPQRAYLSCVGKASDATDLGPGYADGGESW